MKGFEGVFSLSKRPPGIAPGGFFMGRYASSLPAETLAQGGRQSIVHSPQTRLY